MFCVSHHQTASLGMQFLNGNVPNAVYSKHILYSMQLPIFSYAGTISILHIFYIVFVKAMVKLISAENFDKISHFTISPFEF